MDDYVALLPGTLGVAYAVSTLTDTDLCPIRVEVLQYKNNNISTGEYTIILSSLYINDSNLDDYIASFDTISSKISMPHMLTITKIDSMTGIIINVSLRLHLEGVDNSDMIAIYAVDGSSSQISSTGIIREIDEIENSEFKTVVGYEIVPTLGDDYNYNQVVVSGSKYTVHDYVIEY